MNDSRTLPAQTLPFPRGTELAQIVSSLAAFLYPSAHLDMIIPAAFSLAPELR